MTHYNWDNLYYGGDYTSQDEAWTVFIWPNTSDLEQVSEGPIANGLDGAGQQLVDFDSDEGPTYYEVNMFTEGYPEIYESDLHYIYQHWKYWLRGYDDVTGLEDDGPIEGVDYNSQHDYTGYRGCFLLVLDDSWFGGMGELADSGPSPPHSIFQDQMASVIGTTDPSEFFKNGAIHEALHPTILQDDDFVQGYSDHDGGADVDHDMGKAYIGDIGDPYSPMATGYAEHAAHGSCNSSTLICDLCSYTTELTFCTKKMVEHSCYLSSD